MITSMVSRTTSFPTLLKSNSVKSSCSRLEVSGSIPSDVTHSVCLLQVVCAFVSLCLLVQLVPSTMIDLLLLHSTILCSQVESLRSSQMFTQ